MSLDVARIRADFPILQRRIGDHRLVYLDSASSTQKPQAVLDAMDHLYATSYANVHRGVYAIAEEATTAFEAARATVARFVGAPEAREIVFTRNATEAVNLIAHTWARSELAAGDVVVLTHLEHHANIVPWHQLAAERGIELRWIPLTVDHRLDLSGIDALLAGAKLCSFTAMSNVTGSIVDVAGITAAAHAAGATVHVDACQAVAQIPVDVTAWDADFVTFSSHKLYGPAGIGALWARAELLEAMPPFLGGGEMIRDVTTEGFTTNDIPWKFEAGTPAIAEAVGFGAALDYLTAIGMDTVRAHERDLTAYALGALRDRFDDRLRIFGPPGADDRGGVVSFLFDDIHAHDVSQVVDEVGVCVRAGHHCAKPLMRILGVPATSRASFGVYNDRDDVDALVEALARAEAFFAL